MRRTERAILGMAVAGIPGAFASIWFVPSGNVALAMAVPFAVELVGAALALCRVPPFPWLQAKLSRKAQAKILGPSAGLMQIVRNAAA
jgi:hypothetical protein